MARTFEPLGDRVVARPIEREETTKSGIVLPDTAKERPQEAEIIAVGPGEVLDDGSRKPVDVKAGDRIIFSKFAGTEVTDEDETYLVLRQSDILARIT